VTPILAATAAQTAELVAFIVLAPLSVVAALGMVFNRNAVYSALLLVINFFCLAIFYLMLEAQFLAAVQVIVYAGAIMVLFLFVLMLLGVEREEILTETIKGQRTAAVILCALLLAGIITSVLAGVFQVGQAGLTAANAGGNVAAVGRLLFTRYTLAFEATGVLLLVAGVGALVLGKPRADEDDEAGGRQVRRRPRTGSPADDTPEVREPQAPATPQPDPDSEPSEAEPSEAEPSEAEPAPVGARAETGEGGAA
jgi:NADH-quinone oxidoreductase subunit J